MKSENETEGQPQVATSAVVMARLGVLGNAIFLLLASPIVLLIGGVFALIEELPDEIRQLRKDWNRKP